MSAATARLSARGVHTRFGGVQVLDGVDVDLEAGRITGLIGPNGAGKTTLVDVLLGLAPHSEGTVALDGARIDKLSTHERARLGIARTFQSLELFDDLSVHENLLVAAESRGVSADEVEATLERLGLEALRDRVAGALSPSERKTAGLGRALASAPSVLLLDEPAAGLDPDERRVLGSAIRAVAETGVAVLLVDHDLDLVLDVCDRVVVLDLGIVIYDGDPAGVRTDERVAAAYLGTATAEPARAGSAGTTAPPVVQVAPVVQVEGLAAGYGQGAVIRDIDLFVGAGEAVALLGPNGAGKTTLLAALAGAVPSVTGTAQVLGRPLSRPHRMARRGVATVFQDHRVMASLTVAENLRLARRSADDEAEALAAVPALEPLLARLAGELSGGQQQLLSIARAMAAAPRLLLVDEVSLGLSPIAARDVLATLDRWRRRCGATVVFAEQHVVQALEFADRAYVLAAGRIALTGGGAELAADPDRVARAYLGTGDNLRE